MNIPFRKIIPGALLGCLLSQAHAAAPAPELPVETFFQTAAMSGLEFSPNGKRILCLVPHAGRTNLAVIDLEKGTKNLITNFTDKEALGPFWASNDRILFFVDRGGDERFELYSVNYDGSDPSKLEPERGLSIIRRLKDDRKFILVQAGMTHRDWPDVTRLDIKTGRLQTAPIAKAPGPVSYYVLDHDNVVRFAVLRDFDNRKFKVLYRTANKEAWTEVAEYGFDQPGWRPLAFDGDNRTIYIASDIGRKTASILRYDTVAGSPLQPEFVFGDDTYDIASMALGDTDRSAVIIDAARKKVVGFQYEADRRRYHWIDDEMRAIHRRMEQSLPDTVHSPIQFSEDGSKIIFYSYSDRDPGVYYLFDRKRQKLDELAVIKPKIDPEQMARMKPISYPARDGLVLHGYLTLPAGREAKNLPLIVHPHGGPYGPRDDWTYNPEVQFYANRGFAVLQVNFRGSGGYGQWFEAAGWKKWGLEMQDDLTDGVKWAIAQGLADPARIVISGASYGGYAAMAGLVYTPELYCAGINYVGVVNIDNVVPKAVPPARLYWYNTRIGDLSNAEDRKRLYDTSPVHFADRIRVPVLMAYGRNDPRVTIDQGYDIERALKKNNRPYTFIVEKEEGHGFRDETKRIAFYTEIDAFLKKHVPATAAGDVN